jgi:hypothetical protein
MLLPCYAEVFFNFNKKGNNMGIKFNALISAAAISVAVSAAPANAFLLDWKFGFDGAGNIATATTINEFLDVVGPSVITTTAPVAGNYTFSEQGAVNIVGHDGGVPFSGTTQIGALLNTITGNADLGGTIAYTGGVIDVYFNGSQTFATAAGTYGVNPAGSTLIGTFTPVTGSGNVSLIGIPNGQQTISAAATFLAPGFWWNSTGADLSTLLATNPVFGFATTNASFVNPAPALVASELGGGVVTNCLPGQTTGGCTGTGNFEISNNGQFRINAVPEPGTLALIGIAMAGLGFAQRRRNML